MRKETGLRGDMIVVILLVFFLGMTKLKMTAARNTTATQKLVYQSGFHAVVLQSPAKKHNAFMESAKTGSMIITENFSALRFYILSV